MRSKLFYYYEYINIRNIDIKHLYNTPTEKNTIQMCKKKQIERRGNAGLFYSHR